MYHNLYAVPRCIQKFGDVLCALFKLFMMWFPWLLPIVDREMPGVQVTTGNWSGIFSAFTSSREIDGCMMETA